MLHFLVDNTQLVLDPQTKIRYELNSCYFDEGAIPAGKVWHFDVPAAENEETFKYSNYIIVAKKYRVYDCVIKLHSYPIGSGKLVVSLSNAKVFRVQVTLNSFAIDFENVKLNEAGYEAERIGGSPHSQANVLQHAKDVNAGTIDRDYRFPMVYAPWFYGELVDHDNNDQTPEELEFNKDYAGYMNNWANNAFLDNNETDGNRNTLVPFPLLGRVLKKNLETKGYSLSGAMEQDENLKKLLLMSNRSIDSLGNTYLAKASAGSSMLMSSSYKQLKFLTEISDVDDLLFNGVYQVPEPGKYVIDFNLIFNCVDVEQLIFGLMLQFKLDGQEIFVKGNDPAKYFDNDPAVFSMISTGTYTGAFAKTVVDIPSAGELTVHIKGVDYFYFYMGFGGTYKLPSNTYLQSESTITISKDTSEGNVNQQKNVLDLREHLPSKSICTVINSLRNTFFMATYFDDQNRTVSFELLRDVLRNRYSVDLSDHVVYGSDETIPAEPLKVKFSWDKVIPVCDVSDSKLVTDYSMYSELPETLSKKTYALLNNSQMVWLYDQYDEGKLPEWRFYAHNYKGIDEGENAGWNVESIFCPMPTYDNGVFYPYYQGQGNNDTMPEETELKGLQLIFWHGVVDGRPVGLSNNRNEVQVVGSRSLSVKDAEGLMYYGESWLQFLRNKEEFKVRLTNIDLFKLVEIQDLFLPKRREDHPRWVYLKNVRALPKQFTGIFDLRGNILDSEMVLCKKGEQ